MAVFIVLWPYLLKFIFFEKATKFDKIFYLPYMYFRVTKVVEDYGFEFSG